MIFDLRPVKKESLWLMSNITAEHQSAGMFPSLLPRDTDFNYIVAV